MWKETKLPNVIVNEFGEVKRLSYTTSKLSSLGNSYTVDVKEKTITPIDNGLGYLQVKVTLHNVVYRKYLHVLVWESFNGDISEGYEIDHKDCNKNNNNLDNLQLMTRKENMTKCHLHNPHILNNLLNQKEYFI